MTDPDDTRRSIELSPVARGAIALAVVLGVGLLLIQTQRSADTLSASGVCGPHGGMSAAGVPEVAPAFSLPDRAGVAHGLAEVAGRPVLLNFWATWCPPCLDEMPALQRMIAAMADTDLAVVAVALDESWEIVDPVLAQTGFGSGALLLLDPERSVAEQFGTLKVPETYLIDRQGKILHRYQGAKAWDSEPFLEDLRAFVAGEFERGRSKEIN